jgi:hypothetical protein
MRRHQHDDDDAFDERGVLRDGARLRVPLTLMDAASDPMQRAVARESLRVTDGQGGVTGLHRPGFRLAATDARKITRHDPRGSEEVVWEEEEHGTERQSSGAMRARDAAYRDYKKYLNDAWKTPVGFGGDPSISFGERGSVGQREGGTGMLDCEENAEDIVRNAARHTESAHRRDYHTPEQMMRDHQNKMADIYSKLDHELSEAWRRA